MKYFKKCCRKKFWQKNFRLVFAILISHTAGIIGSLFTAQSVSTWYQTIEKPIFNPPSWVFAPVWFTLYTLMGIAFYIVWEKGCGERLKKAKIFFSIQLALNALWSILFFGLQNPVLAAFEITFLLFFIILTIRSFAKINKTAAWLLAPYLAWVSFAMILNFAIWAVNICTGC